ncbi:family 10 glycosylhydrolase [candidate division KSB1 bacterium]|nr:family 10 glycosylhydrolase [candidate division KSB1 bacterium]
MASSMVLLGFTIKSFPANKEARAAWVTRWTYTPGFNSSYQRAKIREIMQQLKSANFNMVLFQIRGQGDAFYKSEFEPWSQELTGILGNDPGWDPLQYAIDEARKNSLELHAWVNVYPAWEGTTPPRTTIPKHVYLAHPDWVCADYYGKRMDGNHEGYIFLSPGIPEVREYLLTVCLDITERYNIDGMHFDYIRYPANKYSYDSVSVARFNSPEGNPDNLDWASWQREQVNTYVREFYAQAMLIKPALKVSAAVIGKYDYGYTGWDGYNVLYQDGRRWMEESVMDFLAPMIYWRIGQLDPWAPFEVLLRDWVKKNSFGRHIYAGIGTYKLTADFKEISDEIDTCRSVGAPGQVHYSFTSLEEAGFWDDLKRVKYKDLANMPAMPWKDAVKPNKPLNLAAAWLTPNAIHLTWSNPVVASDGDSASYFNIYRSVSHAPLDIEDPVYLYHITPNNYPSYIDTNVDSGEIYYYWLSALDDADNESLVSSRIKADFSSAVMAANQLQPGRLVLSQNYPNPFNPKTSIRFTIPSNCANQQVSLAIYDVLGAHVKTLLNEPTPSGTYRVFWYGDDSRGKQVPSGSYFCRLKYGEERIIRRMQLIR